MGVFDTLHAKDADSVGVQELASAPGADTVFLGQSLCILELQSTPDSSSPVAVRVMRVVVALGLCDEAGLNEYNANPKTKIMTTPQGISSFKSW